MPKTITINSSNRKTLINSTGIITTEIRRNIHHKSSNSKMLIMVKVVMVVVMLLLIFIDKEGKKIRVMEIKRLFKVVKLSSLDKDNSSSMYNRHLKLVTSWRGQTYIILDKHQMWEVFRKVPRVQSRLEPKLKVKWKWIMMDTLCNLMVITSTSLKVIKEIKMDRSWFKNNHLTVKVLLFLSIKINLRPRQLGKMRIDNSL